MKKIYLIGKFNTVLQDISSYLSPFFHLQVCINNHKILKGMLELDMPDLVLISLTGMNEESGKLFDELKTNYPHTPVLCIGTANELSSFDEYFARKQFHLLTRPVSNDKILETINELLQITIDSELDLEKEEKLEKKSILLVDDNAFQLRTLNEILKEKYEVRMATSGKKALKLIEKKVPDLIFLDYEMPTCDGKMTLEQIREIEEAKDVPVVFFTGVRDKEHIQAVLKLKPAAYLLKPASTEIIHETIDKVLEKDEVAC